MNYAKCYADELSWLCSITSAAVCCIPHFYSVLNFISEVLKLNQRVWEWNESADCRINHIRSYISHSTVTWPLMIYCFQFFEFVVLKEVKWNFYVS